MRPSVLLPCIAVTAIAMPSLYAADWPHWRGPNFDGISAEKDWRSQWQGDPAVAWEAEIGIGFSSFAVSDDHILTTGHNDEKDTVFCLNAKTGKEIWKHSYPSDLGDKYFEGGTSATPTIDGGKVYHLSRWGDLFCFDLATGKVVWNVNVQKESGANIPDWGFAGSPLVAGDLLILNVGKAGMGVDKATGKIIWKSDTDPGGYSTPYPLNSDGKDIVVIGSGRSYVAVETATGAPVWEYPWTTRYGVNAAAPILSGGKLFISSGYNKGCVLLKLTGGQPEKIWESKVLKNQFNSSVLIDGHLYGIDGDSNSRCALKCVRFEDGKEMWAEPSIGFGSLTAADGKLIILTAKGELATANASPEKYDELSRAQILSGKCWSVPVLANGRLLARNTEGHVVCLDLAKK